jgi:hypothetical protein
METTRDLGPLSAQVQRWWSAQHASCSAPFTTDSLGRPFDGLAFLFKHEEIQVGPIVCPMICGWREGRRSEELLASLRPEVRAGAVRAAGLLSQPDVQIAEQVALALTPPPYGEELTLVTDLINAAGAQSVFEQRRALKGAGIAAVVVAGYWLFGKGDREAA